MNLKVGAGLGGQHPDAGGVAGLAEDMPIQRVAALVISFRQETTTILTPVAVNMEITIQSHNPDSLLLAWGWHDRLLAHRTSGGKFLVEVFNAVDEAASIHSERDPIQAAVAHDASKAVVSTQSHWEPHWHLRITVLLIRDVRLSSGWLWGGERVGKPVFLLSSFATWGLGAC